MASINIRHIVNTNQAKAFNAWIKPEMMKKWLCPENMVVTEAEAEEKVGGKYLIAMQDKQNNKIYKASGVFETFDSPNAFSLTWKWEGEEEQTLLTVELSTVSGWQTIVNLTQSGFASDESAEKHKQGWESTFRHFEQVWG